MKTRTRAEDRLQQVQEGYTALLRQSQSKPKASASCCGNYAPEEVSVLPAEALQSSFGCGNPLKFAEVKAGQTVLDIGSGAGIDCFLAAEKVGPNGRVIGLDMTPAMVEKAREIAVQKGYANVEFRLGTADRMPVEDASADWIISNCVINLAPDKPAVFREAFRVLKPGGRLSISDVVLGDDLPEAIINSIEAYIGCIAGAIREEDYLDAMRQAGLTDVQVASRYVYGDEHLRGWLDSIETGGSSCCGGAMPKSPAGLITQVAGKIWSAEISARKP